MTVTRPIVGYPRLISSDDERDPVAELLHNVMSSNSNNIYLVAILMQ